MGVNHLGVGGLEQQVQQLWHAVRAVSKATLQNGAIGRAGLRIYDGGILTIENGGLSVTGTASVAGTLTGSGTFDWTGPILLKGAVNVTGNSVFTGTVNVTGNSAFGGTLAILGATTIGGLVTLNNDLSLGTGRIIAGPVIIDRLGPAGGRIRSTGQLILGDGSGSVYIDGSTTIEGPLGVSGMTNLTGGLDVSGGPKSFKMDHPTRPGWWLRHGSTESPVSGIEYWGEGIIDASGTSAVELPEYFNSLAKPDGRVALVTGRGFAADWTDIEENAFTVSGHPGGRFSWLVKAERHTADFLVEEEKLEAT